MGKIENVYVRKLFHFSFQLYFYKKMSLPNSIDHELQSFLELLVPNVVSLKSSKVQKQMKMYIVNAIGGALP
jgi:hypothetical protein